MLGLSPPVYTFWNKINASIGKDPDVKVNPLITSSNPYVVPIIVTGHDKAVAIASIMALHQIIGNENVDVHITDEKGLVITPEIPGSTDQLVEMVKTALSDNPWFVEVVGKPIWPGSATDVVFVVFKKDVIQFPNDDLSDLNHNYNNVVAFVFSDVLSPHPGGILQYTSTSVK